jgi:hypothetical protein
MSTHQWEESTSRRLRGLLAKALELLLKLASTSTGPVREREGVSERERGNEGGGRRGRDRGLEVQAGREIASVTKTK